jgi:hypothetical protein
MKFKIGFVWIIESLFLLFFMDIQQGKSLKLSTKKAFLYEKSRKLKHSPHATV